MGNQCYARYNIVGTPEVITELKKKELSPIGISEVELDVGSTPPLTMTNSEVRAIKSQEKLGEAIAKTERPVNPTRKGSPLEGLPVIEPSIKQAWSNLKMFVYSYDSLTEFRSPFKFDDTGEIYFGQWKDGAPEGRGFMYDPDKSLYEGSFKNGAKDGRARIVFLGGNVLEGQYAEGRLDGELTYISPWLYFKGVMQNGLHGKVKQTNQTYIFKGEYRQGKRYKGELKWNGNNYTGKFDELGNFHEKGQLQTNLGTYSGAFNHGLKHGEGQFIWKDNLRYKGQYIKDLKEGFGTLYLADGQISYEGQWKNNLPHGRGRTYIFGKPQPEVEWNQGIQKEDMQQWTKPLENH